MSMRMRGMQTKCALRNQKIARFSRDCALRAHCIVCSLVASCLRIWRDFRSILDIIILLLFRDVCLCLGDLALLGA